jgi:zinc transport system permease protein
MIDSFLLAIQQPFFLRSLIVVTLLSMVFPLYGNIVVVRQEANIAHTYAHIWLLWVALWLWFNRSIELSILWSVLVTIAFLYFLGDKQSGSQVVHNEIGAQLWLVWAILIVSQMTWYKADISSYLFGDILLLWTQDIYIILAITVSCILLYILFARKRYALSLNVGLAKSKNMPVTTLHFLYLLWLWLLIWGAMKIIWVLLVSAFLILPSNIWKIFTKNKTERNLLSMLLCFLSSISALFLSWYFDMPSWASIVWLMIVLFLSTTLINKLKRLI